MRCVLCKYWNLISNNTGHCSCPKTVQIGIDYQLSSQQVGHIGISLYTNGDFGCINFFQKDIINNNDVYIVFAMKLGDLSASKTKIAAFVGNKKVQDFIESRFATFNKNRGNPQWISNNPIDGFEYSYLDKKYIMYAQKQQKE